VAPVQKKEEKEKREKKKNNTYMCMSIGKQYTWTRIKKSKIY